MVFTYGNCPKNHPLSPLDYYILKGYNSIDDISAIMEKYVIDNKRKNEIIMSYFSIIYRS